MSQGERTSVGFWLAIGILFAPYVFAWALLRRGYSGLARGLGFAWLACFALPFLSGMKAAHERPTSTAPVIPSTSTMVALPSGTRTFDSGALPLWSYQSAKDDMRGSTDSYASLESLNVRGHTVLRRSAKSGINVMLILDRAQFMCGYDGCSVAVKFDDGPSIMFGAPRQPRATPNDLRI
jgi:hypothetical protein